jgi:hypothetical protein
MISMNELIGMAISLLTRFSRKQASGQLTLVDTMYARKSVRVIPRILMTVAEDMLGELPVLCSVYSDRISYTKNWI